ncbi:unnamed protein product [Hymenolepis diminuta]|nr:unnamed protein product [Hymenolepis diminuta]VUZ57436.1 unnamed protein product [Hymenolepis diminuta]
MFTNKVAYSLSLVCFCLVLLEIPQASGVRLQRPLYDGLPNADSRDESDDQLVLEELSRSFPDFQHRYASKRGFVRLG